jgi:hypothetical protein
MRIMTRAKGKAIAKTQAATPATTETVTYTLARLSLPDSKFKPSYIAKVKGKDFLVGQFDTAEEAHAAAENFLPEWLTQLKPAYRVEKLGTVTVDVGTIMILDPCRINSFAKTQNGNEVIDSPLMPHGGFAMDGSDGKAGKMLGEGDNFKQLVDPPTPAKVANPTRLEDYGTTGGNALSLSTGYGDGEYEVIAEIVDFGGMVGERIAAIHMQFISSEDIAEAKKLAKAAAARASN